MDEKQAKNPRIETERLLLRWFAADDLDALFVLGSEPRVIRYVGNVPFASRDEAREVLTNVALNDYATLGFGRFACVWKQTGEVIGFCGPKFLPDVQEVELGYRFLPDFWGLGLATESARAAVAYARDVLRIKRLIALIHPENSASARVVGKLDFAPERKATVMWFPGVELDLYARSLE
jgi:[ribosomal protein S5]-alanine N-acetyltransferase